MMNAGSADRDVSSTPKRRLPRRCSHFGRNKCDDCLEPNRAEENCDTVGTDAYREGPKDEDVQESDAD